MFTNYKKIDREELQSLSLPTLIQKLQLDPEYIAIKQLTQLKDWLFDLSREDRDYLEKFLGLVDDSLIEFTDGSVRLDAFEITDILQLLLFYKEAKGIK